MQETHEGIKKAQGILKPRQRSIQKKRITARDKKQGSSRTIKRGRSLQAQRQRKTRTARKKKKTEEENKKQKQKRTQAPVKPSDLSWHRQKKPRGTRTEKHKRKNDNKRLSKWQNRIPPKWERKGKSGKCQKRRCREGHTSAHPKEDGQPGTFKRIRTERRKE